MSRCPVPAEALHRHYADAGGHADCYCAEVAAAATLAPFAADDGYRPCFAR